MTDTATQEWTLTAAHRCDRCNARAYVRVYFPNGLDLLLCSHDWAKNRHTLAEVIESVIDETGQLKDGK